MPRETLQQTLARLHAELDQAGPIEDAALRADLERALEEIREVVERAPRAAGEHPLRERLEELALRFEQSHPVLTDAIGGVVRALGVMGI